MSEKKRTKPELRFKGFTEDWEEKKLGEVAEYYSTSIRACDMAEDGEFDLYDANGIIGKVSNSVSKEPYISIIKDGSGVGRVRKLPKDTSCLGTMGCLIPIDGNNIDFIFSHLTTKDFSKHVISGAIPHLYFRDYGSDELKAPSLSEQEKIGTFFKELDELIGAKEQELEKLRQLKAALLEAMFPSEDSHDVNRGGVIINELRSLGLVLSDEHTPNTPRLRFRGFTEPWEKKRLGEIGTVAMCKRVFKSQTSESGDVPFFKIGTFGGTADSYISEELYNDLRNHYPYPEKGDLLISAAGTIGRIVEFNGTKQYFQDSNIVWLKCNKAINKQFLRAYYEIIKWNGLEGSTLKRLYNSNIISTIITLPTLAEQELIGSFFRSQDEGIEAVVKQIGKLKTMKQACLEQMFA